MDIRKAIDLAGGPKAVATACTNRGLDVERTSVSMWKQRNALPVSEWKGTTIYAHVICDLIKAMGHDGVHPLDLCPGAGQYMQQPESEAA